MKNVNYVFNSHITGYSVNNDTIVVSFKQISNLAKSSHVSFEKAFSESMSHEHIHRMIDKFIGSEKASCQFDNLCSTKVHEAEKATQGIVAYANSPDNLYFKDWHGGLYWYKKVRLRKLTQEKPLKWYIWIFLSLLKQVKHGHFKDIMVELLRL